MGYFLALRGRIPQPLHTRRNEEDPSASQNDKVVALLPPTDKQQTCTLPFPPEIIALIISFLPPESATAFALICRTFYYQFLPPPSRPLTQPQRLALLTWLEQDTPSLYLCHGCVRLHTWRREPEPDPSNGGVARYDWHCNNRASHFCRPRPPSRPLLHNLDFHLARLVVNRHLHGKSHGPSLASALNLHDIHHKVEPNGVTINEAWDARVIRGELYLRAVVRVYHDRRDATALWDHLVGPAGAGWFPICRHVGLFGRRQSGEQAPKSRRLESDAADPEGGGAEMTIRRRGKISSCKYCYTDFWVDVGSLGENGWVLIMVAWYGLGRCRSPEEEEWHNFVHAWPRDISVPRICEGVAGVVYCVWRESQEGVSVDLGQLDARFVNDELVKPRVALAEKKHIATQRKDRAVMATYVDGKVAKNALTVGRNGFVVGMNPGEVSERTMRDLYHYPPHHSERRATDQMAGQDRKLPAPNGKPREHGARPLGQGAMKQPLPLRRGGTA